jgi:DNA polymerase III alpha subunit (gram-positive type)
MAKPEVYISMDVETDGPIPGEYSMLNMGAAAFMEGSFEPVSTFNVNLKPLVGAKQHPGTMDWWKSPAQIAAYVEITKNQQDPATAMDQFVTWLAKLNGKPVFVGYPAGFDFTFVYWYLVKFTGFSPFSFSGVDIKTYAMAMLKKGYRDSSKKAFRWEWKSQRKHTHIGVDDAIEQGETFMRMLEWNKNRTNIETLKTDG